MHLGLADLRLFRHVAEAGSITAGAARAGLALASASARVRGMEAQAGIALLERHRRGVVLTPAGEALLGHARLVLMQIERMRGDLGEYARGLKGQVRLLANTAAAELHLPPLLASFLAANPQVDVELIERPSSEIGRQVAAGLADAGISAAQAGPPGLECAPWRSDRLVLVVPAGHPLAARTRSSFAASLGFEFVGLSSRSALAAHLALQARLAGRQMRVRVRVQGLDVVCRMVALGAGLAVVPQAAARRWAGGGLVCLTLDEPWAERRLLLLAPASATLPAHARRLVAHLRESAQMPLAFPGG